MLMKPALSVIVISAVLVVYCALINFEILLPVVYFIFSISPFLLLWLASSVLRDRRFTVRELKEEEEWGYQDRNRDDLDVL